MGTGVARKRTPLSVASIAPQGVVALTAPTAPVTTASAAPTTPVPAQSPRDGAGSLDVAWKKNLFIAHPAVAFAMQGLREKADLVRVNRMSEGAVIIGQTGAGKTWLLARMERDSGESRRLESGQMIRPFLRLAVPAKNTRLQFAKSILKELGDPLWARTKGDEADHRVQLLLTTCEVRFVAIDNFHDVPKRSRERGIENVLSWLRDLMDTHPALYVLFGNAEAEAVINSSPEINRRFPFQCPLSYLSVDSDADRRTFSKLVVQLQRAVPLTGPPMEITPNFVLRFFFATYGMMKYAVDLFDLAWRAARTAGRETLEVADFEHAFSRLRGRIAPGSNPFEPGFQMRVLDRPGEPFHLLAHKHEEESE